MKIIVMGMLLALIFQPVTGNADELKEIVSAGPAWDTFTNRDGSGLYHETVREIFSLYGLSVHHDYVPTDRGDELVRLGQADVMLCDDRAAAPLVEGRYPLYTNDFFVFFSKKRIGSWNGTETLRDKEIVCQLAYYHDWDFPVPVSIRDMSTGAKCLEMVLLERSDFYVDDLAFIKTSMQNTKFQFDPNDFDIQRAGTRAYYPLFNQSPRGKKLRQMYDKGIMTLHKKGKLLKIYKKWGHSYPDFDKF